MNGDAATASDINRSHFNEEAAEYDHKHRKVAERLTRELRARLDFIGVEWAEDDDSESESDEDDEDDEDHEDNEEGDGEDGHEENPRREVRMLDYACGTGVISRALAPFTTQCVGMDVSENMVKAYNMHAENQGLSQDEMYAVHGDLAAENVSSDLSSTELFNFDLAAVGGALHHMADPERALKRLVERLKPNGVLLVWDFLPHAPMPGHDPAENTSKPAHDAYSSVFHLGFSEEHMREMFTAAGAGTDFQLEAIWGGWVTDHGHGDGKGDGERMRREVFFARGTKG